MDQQLIISLLGGLNFIQIITQLFTLRHYIRKEKASAKIEEANSVEKSQEIYNMLTQQIKEELAKLIQKKNEYEILIQQQTQTIGKLNTEVEMLHKIVKGYQEKCINCSTNAATK